RLECWWGGPGDPKTKAPSRIEKKERSPESDRLSTRRHDMATRVLHQLADSLEFRSPLAKKFARLAALGWLGFLGALGFLGFLPGWGRLLGFSGLSGFFGFFGFLGVAVAIERIHRLNAHQ